MIPTNAYPWLGLLLFILTMSCKERGDDEMIDNNPETSISVNYEESLEDFPNPERGFYRYSETSSSNYNPLSEAQLANFRNLNTSSNATYESYSTIVFRYFILDDHLDSPIKQSVLEQIQLDFDIARNAGVKLIPRFCYTTRSNAGACPESFICPPYGDAPKDIVLNHILQIAPILNNNTDVILCVQMGFIGTWGEGYYTDYFGDPSTNASQGKILDNNWQDRVEVLQALLDNLDKEIMVQVRYPQMKQRTIYGINALTNVAPLAEDEAFSGEDKARIGFHNDCLFASADDFGTYEDYGNSSSPRQMDINALKSYFAEDGKFVYVGGETCTDDYSPQNDCAPAGMADEDLRKLHYTYLNADYNNQVNNDWVEGDCMEAIKRNLGYRFVLKNGTFEKVLSADRVFDLSLSLENVGYASILKNRPVFLVLKNTTDGSEFRYALKADMREWLGTVSIQEEVTLAADVINGEYKAYLFLPDSHSSIQDRPEYAIRLANIGMWEAATAYNDLGVSLSIE